MILNCSSIRVLIVKLGGLAIFLIFILVVIKYRGNGLSINGNLIEGDHDPLAGLGNWGLSDRGSDLRCQFSPRFIVIGSRL